MRISFSLNEVNKSSKFAVQGATHLRQSHQSKIQNITQFFVCLLKRLLEISKITEFLNVLKHLKHKN